MSQVTLKMLGLSSYRYHSTKKRIIATLINRLSCIKKPQKNRKKLPQEHLIGCRSVKLFLLKDFALTTVTITTVTIWVFEFCHNLIFLCFLSPLSFLVLSYFVELCHNLFFEFGHNSCFWVSSHFEFEFCNKLSLVTVWFFEVCHNLCFWALSQFYGKIRKAKKISLPLSSHYCHNCVTIRVFEFGHNFNFLVLS